MTTADPRFLRSQQAIVSAARTLLLDHGPSAVTHARVAEMAGVGRATVYRHWPRPDLLLAAAMAAVPMPFFRSPSTPTKEWLRANLTVIARELQLDNVRAVATTLAHAALWDQNMDNRRSRFADVLADRLATALDDAQGRGELTLRLDSRSAAALVLGPIYYRSTIEHAPTDDAVIDAALAALGDWA